MHLKMFEFPRAKDVVFVDQYTGRVYMNEANTNEDFWATGSVNFSRLGEGQVMLQGTIFVGDKELNTEEIIVEEDKRKVMSVYSEVVSKLKSLYTDWVYKNILGGLTTGSEA